LVVAKLHLDLVFLHFHSQADSPNTPLPQTFLHPLALILKIHKYTDVCFQ
jgi:hypothetical protein